MRIKALERERIRLSHRKMGVTGAGVRNLWRIMSEKAARARAGLYPDGKKKK